MNKREAGEDFYFLSKLAKVDKIGYIKETCVYPSARSSSRVPFGTGKRIQRFLAGVYKEEYFLYDPRIFVILADWLQLMKNQFIGGEDEIIIKTELIHPMLKSFLKSCDFDAVWAKICRNAKDEKTFTRQFNDWFDGFKTLKLINYFTRKVYPQINMFEALERILSMLEMPGLKINTETKVPRLEEQIKILQYLRTVT